MNELRAEKQEGWRPRSDAAKGGSAPVVIDVRRLSLSFDTNRVLDDISFQVREGEALAIVGASGVGKSTVLKLILRLLVPDAGQVLIDGEDINLLSFEEVLEVRQKMGMVFQAAALFDSLSVYENVAYPLREHMRLPEAEVEERVGQALAMVDMSLAEFAERLPAELSGGQKKRVGIARAIVHQPKILLYDEPTTGLDPVTARTIVELMKKLQAELDVTSIIVSHDVRAVLAVSSHIAMLRDGRIIFYGTPEEMVSSTDPHVREFVD
jgi:phospholipid/cholesterol/gamma-HCH transport system ATP-binding protein